jgi:hypothetical protein
MTSIALHRIRLAFATAALLLAGPSLTSPPVEASVPPSCQGPGIYLFYYLDPGKTQIRGEAGETCDYVCRTWGQVTQYVKEVDFNCY